MSPTRLLFQTLPLAIFLTGCATAPAPLDPRHDPANAAAMESPPRPLSGSLMASALPVDLNEKEENKSSTSSEMKDMPGMKGMSGMKDMPEMGSTPATPSDSSQNMSGMKGMDGMKGMSGMDSEKSSASAHSNAKVYTCPMHPEVHEDKPGKCPKCGMTLVLKKNGVQP